MKLVDKMELKPLIERWLEAKKAWDASDGNMQICPVYNAMRKAEKDLEDLYFKDVLGDEHCRLFMVNGTLVLVFEYDCFLGFATIPTGIEHL